MGRALVSVLWFQNEDKEKNFQEQKQDSVDNSKSIMQVTKQRQVRVNVFSAQCMEIMDFFLTHVTLYHTPITTALSLERPITTIRTCMSLLNRNSYLSKISKLGTVYHVTKENMEFWRTDFKNYVLALEELKKQQ